MSEKKVLKTINVLEIIKIVNVRHFWKRKSDGTKMTRNIEKNAL